MKQILLAGVNSPHVAKAEVIKEVQIGNAKGFMAKTPVTIEHKISKAAPVRDSHKAFTIGEGFYVISIAQELNVVTGSPQNSFD